MKFENLSLILDLVHLNLNVLYGLQDREHGDDSERMGSKEFSRRDRKA